MAEAAGVPANEQRKLRVDVLPSGNGIREHEACIHCELNVESDIRKARKAFVFLQFGQARTQVGLKM